MALFYALETGGRVRWRDRLGGLVGVSIRLHNPKPNWL
jgi:hypothetical protein